MHYAAPKAALSYYAGGARLEREHLDSCPELLREAAEGAPGFPIYMDVVLMDLICQHHEAFSFCKLEHALHDLTCQDVACRVARVDHYHCPRSAPACPKLANCALELFQRDCPACLLIQEVTYRLPTQ